ncbi:Holliday junction resolvase RuvX [candidate division KSB1 bacterium]|nr:Holliday junction resolvase RuvX [candidate division KSB1 bacterium]RQW01395.1 MAG: Holliday junction resolvase RuvX [candidate division KSB1 bacterium]
MKMATDPDSLRGIRSGRIVGIDYGHKRIGLAMSDPFQMMASTLDTLANANRPHAIEEIATIVRENDVCAIVVGKPLHMSGDEGEMTNKVREFVGTLADKIDVPIFLWDERWTTMSAEKLLIETGRSPSRNRHRIDQVAAAYLLQSFLDRIAFLKREEARNAGLKK